MIHSGTEAETRLVMALLHLNHRVSAHGQSAAAGRIFYSTSYAGGSSVVTQSRRYYLDAVVRQIADRKRSAHCSNSGTRVSRRMMAHGTRRERGFAFHYSVPRLSPMPMERENCKEVRAASGVARRGGGGNGNGSARSLFFSYSQSHLCSVRAL